MVATFWKKQFTLKKLRPIHKDPSIFIASQWQRNKTEPNIKYLIYRTAIMLIYLVTWIISIVNGSGPGKWPIFLTNWGYTLCIFQATLVWFMLFSAVLESVFSNFSKMKKIVLAWYPVYWLINTIATSSSFGITLIYWTIIYDANVMTFDVMNYFVHGNNSLLMLIDLLVVAHPIRALHVVYSMIFALMYTTFSLIYFLAGGTSKDGTTCIYKILNWGEKPLQTAMVCLGVIGFIIVLHMFVVLVFSVRRNVEEKCCGKKIDISMTETKRQAAYVNEAMSNDIV